MDREMAMLREGLLAMIAREMPDAARVEIVAIERAASGNSSENWFVDVRWTRPGSVEEQRRLVLRRSPANEIVRNSRIDEFLLLAALNDTPLPVPKVHWIDGDGRWFGRPAVVLERCAGRDDRALLTARNKAGLDEPTRLGLARDMVELLAAIHSLELDRLELPASIERAEGVPSRIELDRQEREALADEVVACVEMRAAAWWLRDNLPPPPRRRVLVHGDFRPANLLVERGQVTALLDWEFAHVGDPAEDIGWYLAPRYRDEHFIPGHWQPEDFMDAYERKAGLELDRASVDWWAIFAQYKLCAMVLAARKAFVEGDAHRIPVPARKMLHGLLDAIDAQERKAA